MHLVGPSTLISKLQKLLLGHVLYLSLMPLWQLDFIIVYVFLFFYVRLIPFVTRLMCSLEYGLLIQCGECMRTTSSPSSISCVKQWPFDLSISLNDKPCIVSIIIPTIVVWYGIDGERRKIKAMRVCGCSSAHGMDI